jgi:hypothetical protein
VAGIVLTGNKICRRYLAANESLEKYLPQNNTGFWTGMGQEAFHDCNFK